MFLNRRAGKSSIYPKEKKPGAAFDRRNKNDTKTYSQRTGFTDT